MSASDCLPLEQYAAVAARILHDAGVPLEVILADLGIAPASWHASAVAWERALDEDLSRGDDRLLALFIARFSATRAALGRVASARAAKSEPLNGPETMAVRHERVSLPAMPFRSSELPPPVDDAARRALARTGLPFVPPSPAADDGGTTAGAQGAAPTLRSPRMIAVPEPPSSASVEAGPATLRLDVAWSPGEHRAPRPPSQPPHKSASRDLPAASHAERAREDEQEITIPIPLVRVKRRSPRVAWLVRIRGWLRGGRA